MASGSNSAQAKNRRPGNWQKVTSHAVMVPVTAHIMPTPSMSCNVVISWVGMTCANRCGHTSPTAPKLSQMSANTGIAMMPASARLPQNQPSCQIWLGARKARLVCVEDIRKKSQKKLVLLVVPLRVSSRFAIKNYFQLDCRRNADAWQ